MKAAVAVAPPSPILALHARYEAAWDEYNAIDDAKVKLNTKKEAARILSLHYEEAMKVSSAETDALRLAIFFQVPTTWQEAMILQFHVHSIYEPGQVAPEDEQLGLLTAVETLFDFMCDEIEHEDISGQFQRGEHIVSQRRRYRTGKVER